MGRGKGVEGGQTDMAGPSRPPYPMASLALIALVLLVLGLAIGSLAGTFG